MAQSNGTSQAADTPNEAALFEAANRLRGSVESSEYKHLVLGLVFLKYVSDSFEQRRSELEQLTREPSTDYFTDDDEAREALLEDRDEYLARNVFWVPKEARWPEVLKAASLPDIGPRLDQALEAIERENPEQLRGVLPRVFARAAIDHTKLGELVSTVAQIGFGDDPEIARDILGRTYEYFIKEFRSLCRKLPVNRHFSRPRSPLGSTLGSTRCSRVEGRAFGGTPPETNNDRHGPASNAT